MEGKNPILNNPYEEPQKHYSTHSDGSLDYQDPKNGRRIFFPDRSAIPVKQKKQGSLFSIDDIANEKHIINLLRKEIKEWRKEGYPSVTRVTKELLYHWFSDNDNNSDIGAYQRIGTKKLFFAQREAIETAIWLNEVASRSNLGTFILTELQKANEVDQLPRIAFKMATGTGKTTVMALLITYHFLNRKQYPSDTRFADYFIIITPNITIKDRLQELATTSKDRKNVYADRSLIPHQFEDISKDLASKVFITNYHTFMPRNLSGNKVGVGDNKEDYYGNKNIVKKSFNQLFKDELPKSFSFNKRLIVINDEAHHCYLPVGKGKNSDDGTMGQDENERAKVWINAIYELSKKFKLQNVYDLSATPYYLLGSGYNEGQLFGWIVTDFSLVEAIESGLVKIPYLPDLDYDKQHESPLKDIYKNTKDKLPNKKTKVDENDNPRFPAQVQDALKMFYDHYEKGYDDFRNLFSINPVMIIVCANTALSKEMYRYVAGFEKKEGEETILVSGKFNKFSNIDDKKGTYKSKPATLLIDSKALEDASSVIDSDFKKTFHHELENFEKEYAIQYGSGRKPTESEILREVLNTVGKSGRLGGHIHCVISVAMLTEGWDANTVTHIFGLRAFGSQLLCEQVIGRALRRKEYLLGRYDSETGELLPSNTKKKKFNEKYPPEYAYVVGIPFDFVGKGTKTTIKVSQPDSKQIYAVKERTEQFEIIFPKVESYQVENLEDTIDIDYNKVNDFEINEKLRITQATLSSAIEDKSEVLDLESIKNMRHREVIFSLTARFVEKYCKQYAQFRFQKFRSIFEVVEKWYYEKIKLTGSDVFKQLVIHDIDRACEHINRMIVLSQIPKETIIPTLNHYQPFGYTRFVQGITTKPVYETQKSHVNYVVADTLFWEQKAAEALENMVEVKKYVKNEFLDFKIPYINDEGLSKSYLPDFISQVVTRKGETVNLIIEVTGSNTDNKPEKKSYTEHFWIKGVNHIRNTHPFKDNPYRWDFMEITNVDAFEGLLRHKINLL